MLALPSPEFTRIVTFGGKDARILQVGSRVLTLTGDREAGFGSFALAVDTGERKKGEGGRLDESKLTLLDELSFETAGREPVWTWAHYRNRSPQTTKDVGEILARAGFDPELAWRIARLERYSARDYDVASRLRLGFMHGPAMINMTVLGEEEQSALALFTVQRNRTLNILDAVHAATTAPFAGSGIPAQAFFRWWRTPIGQAWWPQIHARTNGVNANVAGRNGLKYSLAGLGFEVGVVDCVFGNNPEGIC